MQSDEADKIIEGIKDVCVQELGLDAAKYEHVLNSDDDDDDDSKVTHEEKCLVRCIFMKMGHVLEDGSLKRETVMQYISQSGASIDFAKCQAMKNDDPCEEVFEKQKCIMDQLPKS